MNKKTEITVSIPTRLLGEIALKLYDPGLGSVAYGARSGLIVKLLQDWLDKEKEDERNTSGPRPGAETLDTDGNAYDPHQAGGCYGRGERTNPPWRP